MEPRAILIRAVVALATGPEDIRGRLPSVYPILSGIRSADLPKALRGDFEWVMGKLTAREPRFNGPTVWETTAESSVAAMRTTTAVKIARRIVDVCERLRTIRSVKE